MSSTNIDNSEADHTSQETENEIQTSKEFKESVIKFLKIDDLIRKKQTELSELRSQRKPCEEFILKYLDQLHETVIEVHNGKLRKNKSETKVPLNLDIIKQAIETKVKDPQIVESIMNSMDELRPKNTRINLKRTKNRAPKKKKVKAKTKA